MNSATYLGDGLYASFDGWQIKLYAPNVGHSNEVYLEPQVYKALVEFANHVWRSDKPDDNGG